MLTQEPVHLSRLHELLAELPRSQRRGVWVELVVDSVRHQLELPEGSLGDLARALVVVRDDPDPPAPSAPPKRRPGPRHPRHELAKVKRARMLEIVAAAPGWIELRPIVEDVYRPCAVSTLRGAENWLVHELQDSGRYELEGGGRGLVHRRWRARRIEGASS